MRHENSRAEQREERYDALKAQGIKQTPDYLYKSEIKKLQKKGYTVTQISTHPVRKSLLFCQVVFPQN